MNVQQFCTPFVLASLLLGQGYMSAYAQEPAQQPVAQPAQQPAPQGLNNEAIIKLVKAGLSDDLIVSTIGNSAGTYNVSADGMIALKGAGVSDRVVSAIVAKSAAAAQPVPSAVLPLTPMPSAGSPKLVLADGTDVMLAFDEDLSSKTATEGDSVALVLTEDLKVGDVVVAKTGAKAVGEVTHAQRSEMMGKGGELNIRLDYLKAGAVRVHLRGTKGGEGNSGLGGAIALSMLVGVFGLLHKGKEVNVQKGTPLHAYVSDDISLPPAN